MGFWDAFQEENYEAARAFTVGASVSALRDLADAQALEQFEFEDALLNESRALVPTRAVLAPACPGAPAAATAQGSEFAGTDPHRLCASPGKERSRYVADAPRLAGRNLPIFLRAAGHAGDQRWQ